MTPVPSRPPAAAGRPEVEILLWPDDADRREEARRTGRPRLLLLDPGTTPPGPDAGEDWAWSPVTERDLASRLQRLAALSSPIGAAQIDDEGVLRFAGRTVRLPSIEAALMRCLTEPPHRLRTRQDLLAAGWTDAARGRRSLDSRVLHLRRRIEPLGLSVASVRGRGFAVVLVDVGGPV